MILHHMKLIKIVGDEEITDGIENIFVKMGLKGYTILNFNNKSSHRLRLGFSKKDNNVQIEIITSEQNAEKLLQDIWNSFFNRYSVMLSIMDVKIIRDDFFI